MIEPSESAGGPGSDVSSAEEYRAYVDGVLEDGKFKAGYPCFPSARATNFGDGVVEILPGSPQ